MQSRRRRYVQHQPAQQQLGGCQRFLGTSTAADLAVADRDRLFGAARSNKVLRGTAHLEPPAAVPGGPGSLPGGGGRWTGE